LIALLSDNSEKRSETPGVMPKQSPFTESSITMNDPQGHRQPNNPRNSQFHDEASIFLKRIQGLLPVKPIPLTLSQQFQVTKILALQNEQKGSKSTTLRNG
jgi:hypothetical protein